MNYFVTQLGEGLKNGTAGNAWSLGQFEQTTVVQPGDRVQFNNRFRDPIRVKGGAPGARMLHDMTGAELEENTQNTRVIIGGVSHVEMVGGVLLPTATGEHLITSLDTPATDIVVSGFRFEGLENGLANFINAAQLSGLVLKNNYVDNVLRLILGYRSTTEDIWIESNFVRSSKNIVEQTDLVFVADCHRLTLKGNKLVLRAPGDQQIRHNDVIQTFQSGATPNRLSKDWTVCYNWIEMETGEGLGDASVSWMMMEGMEGFLKMFDNVFKGWKSVASLGVNVALNITDLTVYFYNNTGIRLGTGPAHVSRFLGGGTLYAKNNIIYGDTAGGGSATNWEFVAGEPWDNNFIYGITNEWSPNTDLQAAGAHGSITTNPEFVSVPGDDYSLKTTSPLIGKGAVLGDEYKLGIKAGAVWPGPELVERTGAWDPGAYATAGTPLPPNPGPEVKILKPVNGEEIKVKNYTIQVEAKDDTGVAWVELWIGPNLVKSGAFTTMTYNWNTSPYKGKGPIIIKAIAKDAEGLTAEAMVVVTVKKGQ